MKSEKVKVSNPSHSPECPKCARIPVSPGLVRRPSWSRSKDPFKVVFKDTEKVTISVDASSLELARAAACGHKKARIYRYDPMPPTSHL